MGARVVDVSSTLKVAAWVKEKPADYKGKDLDNALKAFEAAEIKSVPVPAHLPDLPKLNISEIEDWIKKMESAMTTMNKALAEIKKMASALQAVTGAAKKTSSDLQKLAKDKSGADKDKYSAAASAAANIGETAAVALKNVQ